MIETEIMLDYTVSRRYRKSDPELHKRLYQQKMIKKIKNNNNNKKTQKTPRLIIVLFFFLR
jgi:hypothetical protein